jgi:hypothetical protein
MLMHVLVGQRKEKYAGEYAPEALAVIGDEGMEENPAYMEEMHAENRATGEFESLVVLKLEIDQDAVMAALRPAGATLAAKILKVS